MPILLIFATIVEQSVIGLDTDVSWLLIVGERVLDGQRLYVDIFEVNPPASVLIYLPGIAIARAIGVTPEFATATLVFALAAISFWSSGRLLRIAGLLRNEQVAPLLCCAVFAFLLLPGAVFAQREHLAVLTLLPLIAALTVRMEGRTVRIAAALLAGAGGGITVAIKPHFILAVAPMILHLMWRRRSTLAGLHVEMWAAASVMLAYGVLIITLYPVYLTEALPLLKAVYLPSRISFQEVWLSPAVLLIWILFALSLFLARSQLARSRAVLPLLAALGFAAALGAQGKGYLNHAYPSVALGMFALLLILVEGHGEKTQRAFSASAVGLVAVLSSYVFVHVLYYPELAQLVKRVAPPQPRIIVAGSNLSVGHPLTRWVDGQWVGRRGALWVTGLATALLKEPMHAGRRATLKAYVDEDRRIFVEDVAKGQPDVVLIPGVEGLRWIASHQDVARAMKPYRKAGVASDVYVMVRSPASPQTVVNDARASVNRQADQAQRR